MPIETATASFQEMVRRARDSAEEIVITEGERPVAAIVDIATLRELQHARDLADIAICERSKAESQGGFTHEQVVVMLAGEDANRG